MSRVIYMEREWAKGIYTEKMVYPAQNSWWAKYRRIKFKLPEIHPIVVVWNLNTQADENAIVILRLFLTLSSATIIVQTLSSYVVFQGIYLNSSELLSQTTVSLSIFFPGSRKIYSWKQPCLTHCIRHNLYRFRAYLDSKARRPWSSLIYLI